jgi:hypothetical protein
VQQPGGGGGLVFGSDSPRQCPTPWGFPRLVKPSAPMVGGITGPDKEVAVAVIDNHSPNTGLPQCGGTAVALASQFGLEQLAVKPKPSW